MHGKHDVNFYVLNCFNKFFRPRRPQYSQLLKNFFRQLSYENANFGSRTNSHNMHEKHNVCFYELNGLNMSFRPRRPQNSYLLKNFFDNFRTKSHVLSGEQIRTRCMKDTTFVFSELMISISSLGPVDPKIHIY
jgi:hypothetical protein